MVARTVAIFPNSMCRTWLGSPPRGRFGGSQSAAFAVFATGFLADEAVGAAASGGVDVNMRSGLQIKDLGRKPEPKKAKPPRNEVHQGGLGVTVTLRPPVCLFQIGGLALGWVCHHLAEGVLSKIEL